VGLRIQGGCAAVPLLASAEQDSSGVRLGRRIRRCV